MPEKEGVTLMVKRLGPTTGCDPEERVSVGPCPQEPAPDRTQGPSTAEETPKSPGLEALPRNGEREHQQAASARRMDSLEETLRELEATLSQMGMDPTVEPSGSPPPLPPGSQSGGGTVPPMKVVTPGASRLKAAQGQAGSPDKGKHGKQRAEYMRIQAQQ